LESPLPSWERIKGEGEITENFHPPFIPPIKGGNNKERIFSQSLERNQGVKNDGEI